MNIRSIERIHNSLSKNWEGYTFDKLQLKDPGLCLVVIKYTWHDDLTIKMIVDYKNGMIQSIDEGRTPHNIALDIINDYAKELERGCNKWN